MSRFKCLMSMAVITALPGLVAIPARAEGPAKNIILMISDGQGFNTVKATDYYTGTTGVYESFAVKGAMNTSSAGASGGYVGTPYNPAAMWADYNYQKTGATDSASAATAMYAGVKIYDNQINKTTGGTDLTTFFEVAAAAGKSTGAVSTVNFDHATPAAVVANTTNRNDYATITSQMINSNLDVIMGAGNPAYNNNGAAVTPSYSIVGNQANWTAITGGANGRTFIETKADFDALANGTLAADKVFAVAQVRDTLQDSRTGAPGSAFNTNVPTLTSMTKGALNVLDNNADGFAVMIEGGAVDWANHANGLKRMIDEQIDFNNAVLEVVNYLNAGTNGNDWTNTLLIVTADHETGCLWGPNANTTNTFTQILDNGAGILPGASYSSGSHTNGLVPFYAKGAGAELFESFFIGTDSQLSTQYGVDAAFNRYIDNTAIYSVMNGASNVPEPASLGVLALGALAIVGRRRRA